MKTLVFSPGRVGPLARYLNYLFLRFPGNLGEAQRLTLECFDTYDRRWSRQGRIWVRAVGPTSEELTLVQPPSRWALGESPSAFGLQRPVPVGRVTLRATAVSFAAFGERPLGEVLEVGSQSFLVLRGDAKGLAALEDALVADGLVAVPEGGGWWVRDREPVFEGPRPVRATAQEAAAPFVVEGLREGLRVARQYEAGIVADVDTECLHQYRVHLRRVRSLAGLGRLWEVTPEWGRLKTLLRELQQRTNELRDLDVLVLDLPGLRASLPWNLGDRLAGWEASVRRRRQAQWRRARQFLKSDEHRLIHDEIEKLFADLVTYGEPWTVGELTTSALQRSTKGLKKALGAVGPGCPDEALHEVRIRAKGLRYVLDALGFLVPDLGRLSEVLKRSQDGLGAFQDRAVLLERLRDEASSPAPGVDALALGVLIGSIVADHTRCRALALGDADRLRSRAPWKALGALNLGGAPRDP